MPYLGQIMAQLNNGDYGALAWVQNEVQQSLADALQILTRFIDNPKDAVSIEPCVTQLHQVTSTMEMLNLQGGLLLSQEMLASATLIRSNAGADTTALQDSLLKGLLLLPNYLNQIGPEIEDHPLRLIDTINELRLGRDEKAITANSLFKPSLSVVLPNDVLPKPHDTTKSTVSLDKVGHAFQVSLLSWIKNNDDNSLNKLSQLVHYLRMSCTHERNILLWWVAEGVIEAINDDGLAVDTKTKLSLGKLNDPIKSLTKHDEQCLLSLFPTDLVHQLLLLVAQSTSAGTQVSQIKATFGLDFCDQQIHQKIYSFTDNTLTEARAGVLEQLLEAKEQLSQFDRNEPNATTVIEQISAQFSSLASSLDLITEETASQILHQHQEILSNASTQDELPSDSQLMALADDLLRIENQLQQANHVSSPQENPEGLQSAVIDECLNELANIKETLTLVENKRVSNDEVIPDTAAKIALIAGSTSMLSLDDTTRLLEGTAAKMTQRHTSQDDFTDNEFGSLTEIIAATELYLEGLSQHGQHQTQFLTQAQHQLDHFEALAKGEVITDKSETVVPPSQTIRPETSVDRYIELKQLITSDFAEEEVSLELEKSPQKVTPEPQQKTSVDRYIQQLDEAPAPQQETSVDRYTQQLDEAPVPLQENNSEGLELQSFELDVNDLSKINAEHQFAEGVDPDIAEVFIEEADEVLAELDTLVPSWQATQNDAELATIRRHFHTLKGSGRMAGADKIGELAWSVEDLLNRALDNQIETSTTFQELVSSSHQLIPALVTRFTQGNISEDNEVEALQTAINSLISPETEAAAENTETTDHELRQIFSDEVSVHISAFKDHLSNATAPFNISEAIIQITHAIKGCAAIVEINAISDVSITFDDKLRQFYQQNVQLNEVQLNTLNTWLNDFESLIDDALEERDTSEQTENLFALLSELTIETSNPTHRIDPETLSVFLEETDELLEQYHLLRQQLQQLPHDEDYKSAIKYTLAKLSESSAYADVNELKDAYQSLFRLSAEADISDSTVSSLIDTGSIQVNNIVENLRNNRDPSDVEDFSAQVEHYFDTLHTIRLVTSDTVETNNNIIDSGPFIIPETDDELLETFTEECAELLESSGDAIKQWQQNPEDDEAALQLQRDLHTLKDDSRLTAITPIADLTHHTESLAIMASDNQCDTNEAFFNLLQRCRDRLADMQDQLSRRDNIMSASDLITEIEQFNGQSVESTSPEIDVTQLIPTISAPVEAEQIATSSKPASGNNEQVRVKAELLGFLTNFAGEINISRDRVSQQNTAMRQQLSEMESTVERLQDQLCKLEMETEAQILFPYEDTANQSRSEFDPLELDRFSQIQQLSRGLTESVTDLHDITRTIEGLFIESDTILIQQSRLSTDLQQVLMNTRLLPFSGLVPRFERIVRQTNDDLGKKSELMVYGADRELDRTILDHIVAPIEHILRNAISHGIESEEERKQAGKDIVANLTLTITSDGSEILITLSDDGNGIDVEKIREKALAKNLINPDKMPSDDELIQLILHSGFSTADDISQPVGRGVGMDVVNSEIRTLKGRLSIQSVPGQGSSFSIRLPLTLSVIQALLIGCADDQYAVPLASVRAIERISIKEVKELLAQGDEARYEFNGTYYKFMALASLLNQPFRLQDEHPPQQPLLLFNSSEVQVALVVDSINSSREIVLKSVGEQLGHIEAINGATILRDGQVVFVLDIPTLINTVDKTIAADNLLNSAISTLESTQTRLPVAMVVDDSITMRKASRNLLKRHGFEVTTARDGIDAVALLNEQVPDVILLDV